jgi:Pectate lyase superfamily protein
MPDYILEGAAENYPTGIHWQVSQACTLQNIHIVMPSSSTTRSVRHRGIFMENGSGGMHRQTKQI